MTKKYTTDHEDAWWQRISLACMKNNVALESILDYQDVFIELPQEWMLCAWRIVNYLDAMGDANAKYEAVATVNSRLLDDFDEDTWLEIALNEVFTMASITPITLKRTFDRVEHFFNVIRLVKVTHNPSSTFAGNRNQRRRRKMSGKNRTKLSKDRGFGQLSI